MALQLTKSQILCVLFLAKESNLSIEMKKCRGPVRDEKYNNILTKLHNQMRPKDHYNNV